MRACVILNPNAGSAENMGDLERQLGALGDVTIRRVEAGVSAEELAQAALREKFDAIIAAGGDGTVHAVIGGVGACLRKDQVSRDTPPCRIPLGILPLGTGNDLARSLGLPLDDLPRAIEILAAGRTRPMDVAVLDGDPPRFFLNTAGLGFTAKLSEQMSGNAKEWLGTLAYLVEGARAIPQLQEYRVRLTLDGERLETAAYNLVIANGRFIGGGIPIASRAELDDGKLDVVLLPALPLSRLALAVPRLLTGAAAEDDEILYRQATEISVEADPPMSLNLDGEPAGQTPACISSLPSAIQILCP